MRKWTSFGLVLVALAARDARAANAAWPPPLTVTADQLAQSTNWPDDPGFGGAWQWWSWTPTVDVLLPANEKAAGVGMTVDAAWQRSIGRHAMIAVMDSGFKWDNPDLINRYFLNRKELPPPNRTDCVGTDPYDCNGDGVFNVRDYTTAGEHDANSAALVADVTLLARADHGDVNHNGYLDPQDLIAVFSDGKDGYGDSVTDGNGFVDDICGWDFFWDDNDAFDDVGNGGQGYSHGNGTTSDSSAEGNNGMGGVGSCPMCQVLPLRTGDSFVGQSSHQAMAILYANAMGADVLQSAQVTLANTPFEQSALDWAWRRGTLLVVSSADETSLHQMYPACGEHTLTVDGHGYDGTGWDDANNTTFLNFSNGTNWGAHIALSATAGSSSEATGKTSGVLALIFSYAKEVGLSPPLSAPEAYQLATMTAFDIDKPGSGEKKSFADGGSGYVDFHAGPGWDAHFGYGRPDARAALDAIANGQIPPEVDLTQPRWFDFFDPTRTPSITLAGFVDASRAPSADYVVEAAPGLEPTDDQFQTLKSGSGSGHIDLSNVTLDATRVLDASGVPDVDARTYPNGGPHKYAVTLRIRATAHYGGTVGDVKGESRKTIFVHTDPDLLPGFPRKLAHAGDATAPSASGESSPKLVDLDGDKKDEIVFGTGDGYVHAMKLDGTELPGFPVRLAVSELVRAHPNFAIDPSVAAEAYQEIDSTVAIGDVDGDGKPEIVVGTMQGELHVLGVDGHEKPGWPQVLGDATLPKEVPNDIGVMQRAGVWTISQPTDGGLRLDKMDEVERGFFASPVLADLDGDGKLDIVQAGLDGYLHAWRGSGGAELPGFPVEVRDVKGGVEKDHLITIRGRLVATPAVGDVDGDGKPEILSGSNETYENSTIARAYLVRADGTFASGWPIPLQGLYVDVLPYVGRGNPNNPVIADLDGDGKPELITHAVSAAPRAYDVDGNEVLIANTAITSPTSTASSTQTFSVVAVNSGSVADLDGDGLPELVDGTVAGLDLAIGAGGNVRHDYDHQVTAWQFGKALQNAKNHHTTPGSGQILSAFPRLTTDYQFLTNYLVADIDGDGVPEIVSGNGGYLVTAWDHEGHVPDGWPKLTGGWNMATPAVGDLDGDGFRDVVTMSRNGYLWAWKTKAHADSNVQWESYHHDLRNSGDTATALVQRAGPAATTNPTPEKKGCGCGGGDAVLLPAFGALLAIFSRRKRS